MMPTYRFLIAFALFAACGGQSAPVTAPTPPAPPADVRAEVPRPEPAPSDNPDVRWAEPGASYTAVFDGLIKVASIATLPNPSYPGRDFQVGVFDDPASWARFTKAAEMDPFGAIDWTKQVVVYTVLDAQTNMLGLNEFTSSDGVAEMQILWVRIEPHYVDASPAVLTLLDREDVSQVRVSAGELPLGTVAI